MKTYRGTISCRPGNEGTHSEGLYALLTTETGEELRLCREGGAPCNDAWFGSFDGQEAIVTGALSHGWLVVERIEPPASEAPETIRPKKNPDHEKMSPLRNGPCRRQGPFLPGVRPGVPRADDRTEETRTR